MALVVAAAEAKYLRDVSPTLFRKGGFRFYFFSREEPRMHVHVHHAEGEAKFWLEPAIELAQSYGLSRRRTTAALALVQRHQHEIRARGKNTSDVEVTNVSKHGFWLLVHGEELFASFASFPWFKDAPVGQILNVEMPGAHHLYWPDLDVDLAVESLANPDAFPLVSSARYERALPPSSRARKGKSKRARSGAARG